ncbi:MAG: hypothetical protein JXB38_16670, partial [Anaerolineales bacterium]|nr:hypothetical protein [Anaerolineales bacterium]
LVLTAEEEAYLVDFAHTFYPRLQETDATDRPIYLIHPDNYAPAVPVFVARMADDGSVFVYPEGLLP